MSKTAFAKTIEAPQIGPYPFNHYNVDSVFCKGRLTVYSMGRLLQRLEWHHQQWIVLSAELNCNHELPVDLNAHRPLESQAELTGTTPNGQAVPEAESEAKIEAGRQQALKEVSCKILWGCNAQHSWARLTAQQFQALHRYLPSGRNAAMERDSSELLNRLFEVSADNLRDFQELSNTLRQREADEEVNSIREDGLGSLLKKHTFVLCDQVADQLKRELKEEVFNYFTLGRCLESALCPPDIYKQMATTEPSCLARGVREGRHNLPEQIAVEAGFVLGSHSFAPGSLKVPAICRGQITTTLELVGFKKGELEKELAGLGPSIGGRGNRSSSVEQPESTFTCMYPAAPGLLTTVQTIHDHIAAKLGSSVPNSEQEIEGGFGESLQILNKNKARLRVGGREDVEIRGQKLIPLLMKLVRSKGELCTNADLSGAEELLRAVQNGGGGRPKMVAPG